MEKLSQFIDRVPHFHSLSKVDQVVHFAWFLHELVGREYVDGSALRECFEKAHIESPNMSVYLPRLASKRPAQLIKSKSGYRLEGRLRRSLDAKYKEQPAYIATSNLLSALPAKIGAFAERTFLDETLSCYAAKAYRAAVVMAWCLAFDHLRSWLMADANRMAALNDAARAKFPKRSKAIASVEDFQDFTESDIIELCRTGRLLNKETIEMLREKLKRRNAAAHPSKVTITQAQADDVISDLVNNIVLQL